jgi:WD40 repeat protein
MHRRSKSEQPRFKAFLSYNRTADERVAAELQGALQQFAKPYNALRACHIFRDKTDLTASPDLWPRIEEALDSSEYFLLLACPNSAQSKWVKRELDGWLQRHGGRAENLLLLWTDGELSWDPARNDFDWERTTALPSACDWNSEERNPRPLRGCFAGLPNYVDLRWARSGTDLSLRNPKFLDGVATVAAELHGKPKSVLIGKDVTEHRRFRRVRTMTVSGLAVLTAVAIAFGIVALWQRNTAIGQRNTATARQYIAEAGRIRDEQPQLALLLAAESSGFVRDDRSAVACELRTGLFGLLQAVGGVPLTGHLTQIRNTDFTADGRWVVSSSSDSIRLWRMEEPPAMPRAVPPLLGQHEWIQALSPGGSRLATLEGRSARVWDLRAPVPARVPAELAVGDTRGLLFSPDGRMLVAYSADAIRLCDVAVGPRRETVREVRGAGSPGFTSVAFTPDGRRFLAGTENGSLMVWDTSKWETAATLAPIEGLARGVAAMDISPDGAWLVAAGSGGEAVLIDLATLRVRQRIPRSVMAARRVILFSPDSRRLLHQDSDNGLALVDLAARGGARTNVRELRHPGAVRASGFSSDGRHLITGTEDGTTRVWDVEAESRRDCAMVLRGHTSEVRAIAASQDSRWLATGSRDDSIRLWDLRAADPGSSCRVLRGLESVWVGDNFGVERIAFSRDGRWLLGRAYEPRLRVWDLSRGVSGALPLVAIGCESASRAPCSDRVWTISAARGGRATAEIGTEPAPPRMIEGTRVDRIGPEASKAGPSGRITVRRLSGGAVRICRNNRTDREGACKTLGSDVHSVEVSPDGEFLLTHNSANSRIWAELFRVSQLAIREPVRLDLTPWDSVRFDRSGRWMADVTRTRLWDLHRIASEGRKLEGHTSDVHRAAFSPDSAWLATASKEAVLLWRLDSEQGVPVRIGLEEFTQRWRGAAPDVQFSADSRWLALRGAEETYVWPLEIGPLVQLARETAGRNLSSREQQTYPGAAR